MEDSKSMYNNKKSRLIVSCLNHEVRELVGGVREVC